jgi:hypothetical protein
VNIINKKPVAELGYGFVAKEHIPKGKDEYYLRNIQNRSGASWRNLTKKEIAILERNANISNNWDHVLVADAFNPELVKRCKFYGLVRIGKLEPYFLEFNNLRLPVGLYNSTIISCDLGDNVVVDNVNFMSHYIIGNEVILANVNELATTDHSKFGNGIIRKGEKESVRIWIEICNENAGRSILPFNGILAGDAWLWSKYRDNDLLQQKFREFTEKKFDKQRGYYGKIGDRTVIKNCKIIKDTWVGTDAYLKGANKLKNLTINSSPEAKSQIGEGCELVNGIIGFGCRIFYGVKAVRFILAHNSQLKYGARLINSYLGDNSTISCCEVLNSLIFPAHEQHHNNSFLCAALVMGQSNMAAGATIGSNHNSRSADGELVAGRGFWPGLCVSLKHNSRFASFTLIAKGDFPCELNIPVPFSLVNNDVSRDVLTVMPGYWFMYNMYALARNVGKYKSRDKRVDHSLEFEYDFLAPDSVNEMFEALRIFKISAARAWMSLHGKRIPENNLEKKGEQLLETDPQSLENLEFCVPGFENSSRKVLLLKMPQAYALFKELISYYTATQLIRWNKQNQFGTFDQLISSLAKNAERKEWINAGGQLMPARSMNQLIRDIRNGKVANWDEVHTFYHEESNSYLEKKTQHAFASLLELQRITPEKFTYERFAELLQNAVTTREWMLNQIYESRAKDYQNPFRQMVYGNQREMEKVVGKLSDNSFINQQKKEAAEFKKDVPALIKKFSVSKNYSR